MTKTQPATTKTPERIEHRFPATQIVYTPCGPINACDAHAEQIKADWQSALYALRTEPIACARCMEAERNKQNPKGP